MIARRCAVAGDRFFHHWQIRAYISNRAVVLKPSGNTGNDSAAIAVLPTEQYISAMKSTPSLMEMTRNPFLLRLFVDMLPSMVAPGASRLMQRVTRYSIYKAFMTQWFRREVARKSAVEQSSLGVGTSGDESVGVDILELLCALLAVEMLKINELSMVLAQRSNLWWSVQNATAKWQSTDTAVISGLQSQYDALSHRAKARCVLGVFCP